jgi:hypothetical protein
LRSLVDQALGKYRPSLLASITGANGIATATPMEAAEVMNRYFVDKVDDLCKKALRPRVLEDAPKVPEEVPDVIREVPHVLQDACQVPQEVGNVPQEVNDVWQEPANDDVTSGRHVPKFFFKFANAKKIAKTIKGLNNTEALGVDNILTSLLKKGVEVLTGPVSHLINRSLAEGNIPAQRSGGSIQFTKGKASRARTRRRTAPCPSCRPSAR